jgi:hypothetical protein
VKEPLVGDVVGVPRRRQKIPRVVAEESVVLCGQRIKTVGILERHTCRGQNQRVLVDRSKKVKPLMGRAKYAGGATCVMHMRGCRGWRARWRGQR